MKKKCQGWEFVLVYASYSEKRRLTSILSMGMHSLLRSRLSCLHWIVLGGYACQGLLDEHIKCDFFQSEPQCEYLNHLLSKIIGLPIYQQFLGEFCYLGAYTRD